MITLAVGQVWKVPFFPNQEDKTQGTVRWILIVEDLVDSVEIIPLTTQLGQVANYTQTTIVDVNSNEGRIMGLEDTSLFIFDRKISLTKKAFISPPCEYKGTCSQDFLEENGY